MRNPLLPPPTAKEQQQEARHERRKEAIARLLGLHFDDCDEELERAFANIEEVEEPDPVWAARETKVQLRKLRAALEQVRVERGKLPKKLQWQFHELELPTHVATCDRLLTLPANVKPKAIRQRQAAWEARALLRYFRQPVQANRGGKWCKLTAMLYGKPGADLSHYCRNSA